MKMTVLVILLATGAFGVVGAAAQDRPMEQGGGMGQGGMRGQGGMMEQGGMMGQGQGRMPNLKELPAERLVKSVRYCDRKYIVTTAAEDVLEFREFDLRIKTDASDQGPRRGAPALTSAGMMGDRAFLVFSDPGEISGYIQKKCAGG